MNILYSSMADLSKPSAQRTHVSEIVNNFAKLGHNVHLIALKKGDLELHSNVNFYKLFPFINKRFLSLVTLYVQKTHNKKLIKDIVKKENIEVIYERDNKNNYGLKIGKKIGIPTFLEINGIPFIDSQFGTQTSDENNVKELNNNLKDIKLSDRTAVVCKENMDFYTNLGIERKKFILTSNGVNPEIFKPMDKNVCRRKLNLGNNPIITFIGSFRPYQGIENAIFAISHILKEIPDVTLLVIGDAGKKEGHEFHPTIGELKDLAKNGGVSDNILFTGKVKHNLIPFYINASDVCIAPFTSKRNDEIGISPLKVFEYLSCGKPVVCSSIKNVKEIIQGNNCGICVEPDNSKELAEKIIYLIKNKKMQDMFGKNGRKTVLKCYTWESIAEKLLLEFENI